MIAPGFLTSNHAQIFRIDSSHHTWLIPKPRSKISETYRPPNPKSKKSKISKGSPLWMLKKKFFKSSFYQSHVMAFGLTIPKWYNTWVLQIFFVNIRSKIFFKIFFPIFLKIGRKWTQNTHSEVFSGVKFNSKTFLFSSLWPKNASECLKIEFFSKKYFWPKYFWKICQNGPKIFIQRCFLR